MSAPDVDPRPTYVLSARALVQHRRGASLALDSRAIGAVFSTLEGPVPPQRRALDSARKAGSRATAISVVSIVGPMAQRAETFCGWIDGYDAIADRLVQEFADPEVAGVVLKLDSPGGDVAGLEDCIRRIVEARDASGKPLGVYVDEYAASAAYWLAACTSNVGIFAPKSAAVGSVGAYTILVDETKALEQEGISIHLVRDPPGKDPSNSADPVPEVALARAQAEISAHAGRFYAAIAAARNMAVADVRALNAATMLAEPAIAAGLIDGIKTLGEVESIVASRAAQDARAAGAKRMAEVRKRLAVAKSSPATPRANGRNARSGGVTMIDKPKAAEEMPPAEDSAPSNGGRASAAEVSASCTECATSCTDCATACESGTADEAITAATACMAACESNIKTLESFLGMSAAPAPEPVPEDVPAAMAEILKITGKTEPAAAVLAVSEFKAGFMRLTKIEQEAAENAKRVEAEQRRQLVGKLVTECGFKPHTVWADQAGSTPKAPFSAMPLDELRGLVESERKAPESSPKPATQPEDDRLARAIESFKSKGLEGPALEKAIKSFNAIQARSTRRQAQGE